MITGRKPKTAEQKRRVGNPGKRPINGNEPEPGPGPPPMPGHLTEVGRETWAWLVGELEEMRVLARCDVAILAMYCNAWSDYVAAREEIASVGVGGFVLTGGAGGGYINPMMNVAAMREKQLHQCVGELGLSGVARARLNVGPPAKTDDGKDKFFRVVG